MRYNFFKFLFVIKGLVAIITRHIAKLRSRSEALAQLKTRFGWPKTIRDQRIGSDRHAPNYQTALKKRSVSANKKLGLVGQKLFVIKGLVAIVTCQITKPRDVFVKRQLDCSDWTMTLFADYNFGHAARPVHVFLPG